MSRPTTLEDILDLEPAADSHELRPFRSLLAQTSTRTSQALGVYVRSARLDRRFWESLQNNVAPVQTILELLQRAVTRSAKLTSIALPSMHHVADIWPATRRIALRGTEPLLAAALAQSTNLTALSLHDNYIGPNGMLEIGRALRNCTSLRTLDLGMTLLGDSSAHSIAGLLRDNTALTFLDLSYNEDMSSEPSLDGHYHHAYENLKIYGASVIGAALQHCTALTYLKLSNHTCIDHDLMEPFTDILLSLPALRSLLLDNLWAESADVAYLAAVIADHPALTHLDLSRNIVGNDGAEHLGQAIAACTTLVSLHLQDNFIHEDGFHNLVPSLSVQSNLRRLNLSTSNMDEEGIDAMVDLLRERSLDLEELTLQDMQCELDERIMAQLRSCRSLTTLNLSNAGLLGPALRNLAMSQDNRIGEHRDYYHATGAAPALLTTLDLSRRVWGEDNHLVVRACRGLTSLDLSHNHIGPHACAELQNCIHRCPNLRDLILHHNFINALSTAQLLLTIERITTVRTTVDFADNGLSAGEVQVFMNSNVNRRYSEYCQRVQVDTVLANSRPEF